MRLPQFLKSLKSPNGGFLHLQWGPTVPLVLSIIVLIAAIVSLILALLIVHSV